MIEYLTSRSRILTRQRCARARYWSDEAFADANVPGSGGFEPVKVAIPLATGGSVHAGLAYMMTKVIDAPARFESNASRYEGMPHPWDAYVDDAVGIACDHFRVQCKDRALDLDALESQSFVYNEQLALTEALVRLAGTRVIPKLIELYEVLEVERRDMSPIYWEQHGDFDANEIVRDMQIMFRSIPDALVRSRADGDFYVISWKTTSEYSQQRDQDARTDMQGLSEPWALEDRLRRWARLAEDTSNELPPLWFTQHLAEGGSCAIRGVQMIYLVKGQRRKQADGTYATQSPLIRGLRKLDPTGLLTPEFATERFYTCTEPHPFKYAKGGTCPGGVNHKRGEDWANVNMWETDGGIRGWMELLERGGAGLAGNAALESAWVLPVPHYRTAAAVASWERQTRAAETRHARDLALVAQYEQELIAHPEDDKLWASWNARLDEVFPQSTERCGDWFHRRCPCWELCHGPAHVAQDPVGSGLYQVKSQYQPEVIDALA